jgi:hypothetical protein
MQLVRLSITALAASKKEVATVIFIVWQFRGSLKQLEGLKQIVVDAPVYVEVVITLVICDRIPASGAEITINGTVVIPQLVQAGLNTASHG